MRHGRHTFNLSSAVSVSRIGQSPSASSSRLSPGSRYISPLQMSDIKNNIIHIHRDMVTDRRHKWVIKEIPKTEKSARFVDMPEEVIAEIRKQGYVTKMTPRQIYKAFKRLLQKNGLDDFTFHDMRHWCVSTLHAHEMPDAYIQHRGGWSSDRIMKQVYLQTLQDQSEILTDKAMSHLIQCCK